jgi:hypothetical protein
MDNAGKAVLRGKLKEFSYTHYYQMSCCLCPFFNDSDRYKSFKIDLVSFLQTETGKTTYEWKIEICHHIC